MKLNFHAEKKRNDWGWLAYQTAYIYTKIIVLLIPLCTY